MDTKEIEGALVELGLAQAQELRFAPLTGGVSSEIYLVETPSRQFVVKRALQKLKVGADWYADTSRNDSEQAYIRYVRDFRPDAMPEIIAADAERGLFVMEYLDGFQNWKTSLLAGDCDPRLAAEAGSLLGQIHARSWGDSSIRSAFDTIPNFDQLRIDPYLRATAKKHPQYASLILAEAARLVESRECLIHGDYSPKNILYRGKRFVPLDCEVACYSDAAFDLSFFLNHLFLKSLYHRGKGLLFSQMIELARAAYANANPKNASNVDTRSAHLLPMLMLARVDGKSPVEYLDQSQQDFLRAFTYKCFARDIQKLEELIAYWFQQIESPT